MPVKKVLSKGKVPAKIWTDEVESQAFDQIEYMTNMDCIHKWVAIMPDVHWGIGATIGSVIPMKSAIIPSAVGVDIGCGMMAVQTNLNAKDMPDNLKQLRLDIEKEVPVGKSVHKDYIRSKHKPYEFVPRRYAHEVLSEKMEELSRLHNFHPKMINSKTKCGWVNQLGTLGSGNHFIEICLDENDKVWVMLHSGSRGIGNQIGKYFISLAKKDMEKWQINLPHKDLAYLPEGTDHFSDYWDAVKWAQKFAYDNRQEMMDNIYGVMKQYFPHIQVVNSAINCHHNYVALENHYGKNVYVTRKGAIRAREGDMGIIPGSMGAKSFIVSGKGNPESFNSCSHGAGRKMSRSKAKSDISQKDFEKSVEGVECSTNESLRDEAPDAYKDIDLVMSNQVDLVDTVHTLRQIVCIKGG